MQTDQYQLNHDEAGLRRDEISISDFDISFNAEPLINLKIPNPEIATNATRYTKNGRGVAITIDF